jgi:outer membrane protein
VTPRTSLRVLTTCILLASQSAAQDLPFTITKPSAPRLIAPYMAPEVAPIRLYNSERIRALLRAGNLYLTVQDAIALAVENNLNLEVDRYGILLAQSALERARAGGPLRGVPSASQQVCNVTGGLGVNGSTSTAGLGSGSGCIVGGSGTGGATIQQVGAVTPNLDPVMQSTATFGHLTQPQANTQLSQTNALIESVSTSNTTLQQGVISGGTIQFRNFQQALKENAPSDLLNPAVAPHMDIIFRHNLLQGFGVKLNDRGIRIAAVNVVASRETFRSQLLDLVTNVLNLYWDVVAANDEVGTRQRAGENAQKFLEDTKKEIAAGGLPRVELPRAEAQLAKSRMDVIIAQATLRQRSNSLKDAILRVPDPAVEAAEIIPVDRIEVPDTDDLPPLRQLLGIAMERRPDVAVSKFRDQTSEMSLAGTANPLLPSLSVTAQTYNRAAAGTPQASSGGTANEYFVGGYGSALGQIFRRNFPNQSVSLSFNAPFGNRQAQGDYGIDQLQYRQSQLSSQRDTNNIVVDISARMSALRQARARYSAAKNTRVLQEQLLEYDREKFASGMATFNEVILDQRTLVTAQSSELSALANYAHARVALDQVLGETLEKNQITLEEGMSGRVQRQSNPPVIGQRNQ